MNKIRSVRSDKGLGRQKLLTEKYIEMLKKNPQNKLFMLFTYWINIICKCTPNSWLQLPEKGNGTEIQNWATQGELLFSPNVLLVH